MDGEARVRGVGFLQPTAILLYSRVILYSFLFFSFLLDFDRNSLVLHGQLAAVASPVQISFPKSMPTRSRTLRHRSRTFSSTGSIDKEIDRAQTVDDLLLFWPSFAIAADGTD